jgi:hypothetical protein
MKEEEEEYYYYYYYCYDDKTTYDSTKQMYYFKFSFNLTGCDSMNRIQMAHNTAQKASQ